MHQSRVTKYDPACRDSKDAYIKQEWTSFNDIGRSHGGVVLSKEDYLRVESAYIEIAKRFLAEDNSPYLHAVSVENHTDPARGPNENSLITDEDLPAVCRSVLREEFWCKLESEGRFLHFGYDYYMYVGVTSECPSSIAAASALGLYVEPFESPYFETKQEET
jgi:hypothetical protein